MNLRGGGATYNQAPSSVLAESNVIMHHPEPKAKDPIKKQVASSVASLLQNDVQGAWEFFGLCPQNDKAAQGDSSGFSPQNDIKKDVILSQRRRIHLKRNWIFHSVQNDRKKSKHAAFTMAEVLITIGIIGVVAAMTLPALINNAQNKELEEGLKRSYSVLSQALDMYYAQNEERLTNENVGAYKLKPTLMKYLNVVQDCGSGHADADTACIPNTVNGVWHDNGQKINKYRTYNNKADINMDLFDDGQFVLNDGSLILIENSAHASRLFISVDLNGFHKNPNRLGQDLFMFQIDEKGKLLPMGAEGTQYYSKTNEYCSPTSTSNMNGAGCTYRALTDKTFFRRKGR